MRLFQYVFLLFSYFLPFSLHAANPQVFATEDSAAVMVLQPDGSVVGWGGGSLLTRDPGFNDKANIPIPLNISDVETIFLAASKAYAVKSDGSLWYWGTHSLYRRDIVSTINTSYGVIFDPIFGRHTPTLAPSFKQANIKKVQYAHQHLFILTDKNELYLTYDYFESGNSPFYHETTSEPPARGSFVLLTNQVADFVNSNGHMLILKTDGRVWTLGGNRVGGLGTGNYISYDEPQDINLSNVKQVYTNNSGNYSLALKNDGTLWGWGSTEYLGIGKSDGSKQLTPIQIDIDEIKSISASQHILVLKNDGTVWGWGKNDDGQLGLGFESQSSDDFGEFVTLPTQALIEDVAAIGAGKDFSVAVTNDGEILTWGSNQNGMLANGIDNATQDTPLPIVRNTLYMPEGFLGDGIEEFVALLNTHKETVNAICSIYYEDGESFSFPLELPPEQRSSFSLKDKGVQFYRPFAIIIEPEQRVTATFIHYAEGNIALGANFTLITSKKWSTAQGFFDHAGKVRNYLVGFNPNDEAVSLNVRMTGFTDVFPRDINLKIEPKRRFSLKLQDYLTTQIPEQPIGALISADKEVVIGMTQYDDNLNEGSLTIAHAGWGGVTGTVGEGWLSDTGFEVVNVLNPNDETVGVSFYDNLQRFTSLKLEPYQQTALVLSDFLPKDQPLSLYWNGFSNINNSIPVIANFNHFDLSGLSGVNFTTRAYRHWEIAEGFKGDDVLEFLFISRDAYPSHSIYVPRPDLNVKVKLYYYDGQANAELDLVIRYYERKTALLLHNDKRIRDKGTMYGITVDADEPIVPYFTHYDFNFGGAFALSGTGWNP